MKKELPKNIEEIKKSLIGKWKFDDGRILHFVSGEEYILRNEQDIPFHDDPHKIFYKKDDKTQKIVISMPLLFEPMATIKFLSKHQFIYDSHDIDGSTTEYSLIRINN